MLQSRNQTPFEVALFMFPDEHGADTLYLVLKATFEVRGSTVTVAQQQRSVVLADEYWKEPACSSLKYAGEAHLSKPATDVVLVGDAHTRGQKPVAACVVSIQVGKLLKQIHVSGERVWQGGLLPRASTAEPFTRMPLVYERAFGGTHVRDGHQTLHEPRNPVGRGFCGRRSAQEMQGTPLPCLEDPSNLIRSPTDAPLPAAPGFIAPSWMPRVSYAGTYDRAWQTTCAPYLPRDFRPSYFQVAHPDLIYPGRLSGGEPVELTNVSPLGPLRFVLPTCAFEVIVRFAGRVETPKMHMETVLFEPDRSSVCLLWRGAVRCDKRALKMEQLWFKLKSMKGVD